MVREVFSTPGAADLCAGADMHAGQLAVIAESVEALSGRLAGMLTAARTSNRPVYAYTFDVECIRTGIVTSAITVHARGSTHSARLRAIAANMLVENPDLNSDGVRLSHAPPRVTLSNE